MLPYNTLREKYEKPLVPNLQQNYHPRKNHLSKNEMKILGDDFPAHLHYTKVRNNDP